MTETELLQSSSKVNPALLHHYEVTHYAKAES